MLDPLEDRQQPRSALAAVEPQELREHVVDVDDLDGALQRAGEFDELMDDGVDALDLLDHGRLGCVGQGAHFHFQTQPGERGAHVVRDAGQHDGAVGVHGLQVAGQLVEAAVEHGDLGRAAFTEPGRRLAPRETIDGAGQVGQRPVDEPADEQATDHGQQHANGKGHHFGAAARHGKDQPFRLGDEPVAFVVDVEADPQRMHAVDTASQRGGVAQSLRQLTLDLDTQLLVGVGLDTIGIAARIDAQALVAGHGLQQGFTVASLGVHERGACQVDGRCHFPGKAAGLRGLLEGAVELVPGAQADGQQQADQRKGAPEQTQSQASILSRSGVARDLRQARKRSPRPRPSG